MTREVPEWIGRAPDTPAPPRVCSVVECGKKVDCHGFCASHARRFVRHGDPLGGTTSRGACIKFVEEVAISYTGDDCLRWPFGDNGKGYGVFHLNRKAVGAHSYICERANGPRPTPKHEAAHKCGNGHELCVNPRHLRWATRKSNHADKVLHGTAARGEKNPTARLTSEKVRAIRALIGTVPQRQIAKNFGICQMTVSHISTGRTWGWLP